MPSQLKYILQAALTILVVLVIIKAILLFYSTELYDSPHSNVSVDNIESTETSTDTIGRRLFKTNCAACHGIQKELVGPALAGINARVADKQLLFDWIRNNQKVLKSGNAYFIKLFNEYGKKPMPVFSHLTDEEIQSILEYVDSEGSRGPIPVAYLSH